MCGSLARLVQRGHAGILQGGSSSIVIAFGRQAGFQLKDYAQSGLRVRRHQLQAARGRPPIAALSTSTPIGRLCGPVPADATTSRSLPALSRESPPRATDLLRVGVAHSARSLLLSTLNPSCFSQLLVLPSRAPTLDGSRRRLSNNGDDPDLYRTIPWPCPCCFGSSRTGATRRGSTRGRAASGRWCRSVTSSVTSTRPPT